MQNTSATWKSLAATDGVVVQAKAIINGVEYTDIEPPVITRGCMQAGVSIGNVVSAFCTFTLDTENTIPKSAEVAIKMRLVGGTEDSPVYSEWLPAGTFYISRRRRHPQTTIIDFECYDALLKANSILDMSQVQEALEVQEELEPPYNMDELAQLLAAFLGLDIDSRTVLAEGYVISEIPNGATIRDELSIIAQVNTGNWIVTPENKLRLVPIIDNADSEEADTVVDVDAVVGEYYVGTASQISGVRTQVGDNTSIVGDESGLVVDVTVSAVYAVDIAETLIGMSYLPFTFGSAFYDPAVEMGDFVSYAEHTSVLYSEVVTLGPAPTGVISAPDVAELADEFPYIGGDNKTLALAKAYAEEVAQEAVEDFNSELTQQEIFDRLTDNGAAQGLVIYNGQIYFNASYIQSGTLTLGGLNNVNGLLRVLNAAGNEVGKWDNSGLEVKEGTFNATAPGGYVAINAEVVPAIRRALGVLWSPSTGDDVLISADRGAFSVMAGDFDGAIIDDGHTNITPGEIDIWGGIHTISPGITINGMANYSGGLSDESTTLYRNGQIRFTDYNDNIYFNLDYLTGMTLQGTITASGGFVGNLTGNCSGSAGSVAWGNVSGKPANYPGGCTGSAGSIATEGDNRNVNTSPNDYQNKLIFRGLKKNTAINSPSSSVFSYLIGLRGWSDSSGGNSHELAFNDTGIFHRSGGSSWNGWKQIPMGDGTGASGTWGISVTGSSGSCTGNAATASALTNFVVSEYALVVSKGVRITYPGSVPVLISAQQTLGNGRLILIGGGYGENTVRNNFTEVVSPSTSNFTWSIPATDSISRSVEIMNNSATNAAIRVWSSGACTFTQINALTSTATNRPLLSGTVTIANGGTGATSAANARTNLGVYSGTVSITSDSNGDATITSSTISINFKPSVFVATPCTSATTGYYISYNKDSSTTSAIKLKVYSGTTKALVGNLRINYIAIN